MLHNIILGHLQLSETGYVDVRFHEESQTYKQKMSWFRLDGHQNLERK